MKAHLIVLAELQALDTKLKGMEADRDKVFARQRSLQAEVDKLKGEFKTHSVRVEELEKEKRAKDGEYIGDRDKLRKWESRLDELRNSREFAALNREVEGLKRGNAETQERILEVMVELETLNKQVRALAENLSAQEEALAAETISARASLGDREAEMLRERESRGKLLAQLPATVAKRYDQLLGKRAGLAVVPARDGICKGCNMGVPPQIFIKVQRAETLETCPYCSRMLYHPLILPQGQPDAGPAGA